MVPREVYASWPLIIQKGLSQDDIEMPLSGIINSESLLGQIDFGIRWEESVKVAYSYGGEKVEIDSEGENGLLRFSIPYELGQQNLLIYFNDKPALAYKVK
jgi:hypothetical protein